MASFTTISEALAAYGQWLPSQPLSTHTRRTYLIQVKQYCTYISTFHWEYGHLLQEPHARDFAVRDYKTALKVAHMKSVQKMYTRRYGVRPVHPKSQ